MRVKVYMGDGGELRLVDAESSATDWPPSWRLLGYTQLILEDVEGNELAQRLEERS